MNKVKILNMKKAGKVIAFILDEIPKLIKPGISLIELDKWAHNIMIKNKVTPSFLNYHNFPNVICASVNDKIVHAIPNDYKLQKGDIVSIDVGCAYNGYHCDAARTYAVGPISHDKKKLMDVTKTALKEALKKVKDKVLVGDISSAICTYVDTNNMSIPEEFSGHGIGKSLHEAPYIYNIGNPGNGPMLKEGMTIAIEPIVHFGKKDIIIEKDQWTARTKDGSMAAHFEETILITKKGYIVLTNKIQKEVING